MRIRIHWRGFRSTPCHMCGHRHWLGFDLYVPKKGTMDELRWVFALHAGPLWIEWRRRTYGVPRRKVE